MKLFVFVLSLASSLSFARCESEDLLDGFELDDVSMLQSHATLEEKKETIMLQSEVEGEAASFLFGEATKSLSGKAVAAEFIAMTLFVTISCGSAMSVAKSEGSAWVLQVALTFGLSISALAYAIGHYSGGQINCAVTFGLMALGKLGVAQGFANFAAQMCGSVFGALILRCIYPEAKDRTAGLATNAVAEGFSQLQALLGEILGTFLLMYVVFETAKDPHTAANRPEACLAIGFAVFLAHSMLIPIDGCSINPTRTFGPALIAKLSYKGEVSPFVDMWVFWVGPITGALLAAGVYYGMSGNQGFS